MDTNLETIKLLTEIKDGLKNSGTSVIVVATIAAAAAIIGSLVSSLIQYMNTKLNATNEKERQLTDIQVELIAKQRQEWMDSIRNIAAELIADVFLLYNEAHLGKLQNNERQALLTRVVKNTSYIDLKLNLKKDKQKRVSETLNAIKTEVNAYLASGDLSRSSKIISLVSEFKDALRDVFEETWQRIKKIDI
jgi:3-dehydroquinate dehydratase